MRQPSSPHALLVRAAVAQRLAACFRYPQAGSVAALRQALAGMATSARLYPDLTSAVGRLTEALSPLDDETLRMEYSRLFIGAGACPLHETAYGSARLTVAAELADIQGFYKAFGFELSQAAPEMADHLGAELEFHAALLVKLAWAALHQWTEPREVTSRAAATFLDTHLGRWPAALASRLLAEAPGCLYGRAAAEVAAYLDDECRHFNVAPVPLGPRAPAADDLQPFACPHAAECGGPSARPEADGATPRGALRSQNSRIR